MPTMSARAGGVNTGGYGAPAISDPMDTSLKNELSTAYRCVIDTEADAELVRLRAARMSMAEESGTQGERKVWKEVGVSRKDVSPKTWVRSSNSSRVRLIERQPDLSRRDGRTQDVEHAAETRTLTLIYTATPKEIGGKRYQKEMPDGWYQRTTSPRIRRECGERLAMIFAICMSSPPLRFACAV